MDDAAFAERLQRTMEDLTERFESPTDLDATLMSVAAASVRLIDGVDSADMLLIENPDEFKSVAATSELPVELDGVQQKLNEGPCLEAAKGQSMVVSNDLREEKRWPRFAATAVEAGVHSVLSFQLYTKGRRSGALNLLGLKPGMFNSEAETVGAMLATHAAIALLANDKQLQFQSALASRDIIGQAKGMIMERFDLDPLRAFELLVRMSQNSNTRVAEIAAEVVARGPARNG